MQELGRGYSGTEAGKKNSADDHRIWIEGRSGGEISGVTEVSAFNTEEVELETTQGGLSISGENLHVKRLTLEKGEVTLEGHINKICYRESSGNKTSGGFIRRLFR